LVTDVLHNRYLLPGIELQAINVSTHRLAPGVKTCPSVITVNAERRLATPDNISAGMPSCASGLNFGSNRHRAGTIKVLSSNPYEIIHPIEREGLRIPFGCPTWAVDESACVAVS
jgi:hypothetical protein